MAKKSTPASEIKRLHSTLRLNLGDILDACKTDEQRDLAIEAFNAARDAFFESVKKDLTVSNVLVKRLTGELTDANEQILAELDGLKDMVLFLNVAADAVKVASSLVLLAAA